MMKMPEQMNEMGRNAIETALRFANLSMQSAEKMMRLQLEAARVFVTEQTENAKALAAAKDPDAMLALRNRLTEQAVERALGYSRNVYEIATQTQSEISQMMEERFSAYQKEMTAAMESMFQNAPAGSEAAVAAMKSSFTATQAAIDNLTKAAKQVAEMADANVKTMVSAARATTEKKKG